MLHTILNYLIVHRATVLQLVGGGAGLSVALEVVLHKFKINSKKVAFTLLHVFTIITSLSTYYLSGHSPVPVYAALTIISQTVHRFAVSPWYAKYIQPWLEFEAGQKAAAASAAPAAPAAEASASPSFT